ncbi:MAG: phosphonate C-P lyase system protein PhnG [Cognatishimia sp.]
MQETQQKMRKAWLSVMAKSPEGALTKLFEQETAAPDFEWLRPPEVGSVMVRGRTGGTGAPFNLGEMTVTRCSLKIASGEVGHGYVQGRRKGDAQSAALMDALMQTERAAELQVKVLSPLEDHMAAAQEKRARKAAATKVDFFTMTRGED